MKLLALLLGASAVAAKFTPDQCPDSYLYFNRTNVADLADCARLSYECTNSSSIFFDSTSGVALPLYCPTKKSFNLFFEDPDLTGPIALPGVGEVHQINFQGGYKLRDNITAAELKDLADKPSLDEADILNYTGGKGLQLLNMSSIDFPDLVNVSIGLGVRIADSGNLSSLTMPKLEYIHDALLLDLSGGPAISLSFPKLSRVLRGISVTGKIDALDFPALNYSHQINVTTTGDLDCVAFAKSVVNTTDWPIGTAGWPASEEDLANMNSSVVCNSKKASVTMYPAPAPQESTGSRSILDFFGNVMLLAILVAGAGCVV
ncbi:hypothetical protein V492_04295 [Pseudogymnoascus sp. VKM F-4246]|nr:hypothetical protein V492_04295 [Pseudogymnoascus sp. VKM F-4246]